MDTKQDYDSQLAIIAQQLIQSDNKKILMIVPESAGDIFLSTSLLPSMKKLYPEYDIYFACKEQYHSLLLDNPNIAKVINYMPIMENQLIMEGHGKWQGLFDISFMITVFTQRYLNYIHNGQTRIGLQMKETI
jgi:hypothetical protein